MDTIKEMEKAIEIIDKEITKLKEIKKSLEEQEKGIDFEPLTSTEAI